MGLGDSPGMRTIISFNNALLMLQMSRFVLRVYGKCFNQKYIVDEHLFPNLLHTTVSSLQKLLFTTVNVIRRWKRKGRKWCYNQMFVYPQNSQVEILTSDVTISGGRNFGVIRSWGWTPHKSDSESSLLSAMWGQGKVMAIYESEEWPSPPTKSTSVNTEYRHCICLDLGLLNLGKCEK